MVKEGQTVNYSRTYIGRSLSPFINLDTPVGMPPLAALRVRV